MSGIFKNSNNIISLPSKNLKFQMGIGEILFDKLKEYQDYVGQIDGLSGTKDTFGSILERSIRTGIAMKKKGIVPGDVVTVCSTSHLDSHIPILASFFIGAYIAPTDPNFNLTDSVHMLKQVKPKIIFVSPDGIDLMEDTIKEIGIQTEIVVFGETTRYTKFSDFMVPSPIEKGFTPVKITNEDETATLFFTSGTSGLPKAVKLSHNCLINQLFLKEEQKPFSHVVCLTDTSPFWVSSLVLVMNGILSKATRLILPSFDTDSLFEMIEKYKVSMFYVSLQHLARICAFGNPRQTDVSHVRMFLTIGSLATKAQLKTIKSIFKNALVCNCYGITELGGSVFNGLFTYQPNDVRFENNQTVSCGVPIPGFSYKVVDPSTETVLNANQSGELRIKTNFRTLGYHINDKVEIFDADGFYKTGDIVYYDESFRFFCVDRIKEVLKYQSWQIVPSKLESIIMTHPAVESAVVFGIPSDIDGDHATAVVVLKASHNDVSPNEIEKYVADRVDKRQRLVGGVKIAESIPTTPSGKFKKHYVKKLVLEGKL